jgi:hypothetical protein
MGQADDIQFMTDGGQSAERERHRREGKACCGAQLSGYIKGPLARVVSGQEEGLGAVIPTGNGESTEQMVDNIEAPPLPGVGQNHIVRTQQR